MEQNQKYQAKVAALLCGSKPLSFSFKDDGSAVVINSKGQKCTFPAEQVKAAFEKAAKSASKKKE